MNLTFSLKELKRDKGASMYEATHTAPEVVEIGRTPAEAVGLLIISLSSLGLPITIQDGVINWDRYYERNWHDAEFKKGLPGYHTRVKFDNHTPIQFKGHQVLINELGGFRVMHRELQAHERKIFTAFVNGYDFNVFHDDTDKTSTIIIPTANY